MPSRNRLSIYLIKEAITQEREIIKFCNERVEIAEVGTVYIGSSENSIPDWIASFFNNQLNSTHVFTANARAVLLVKVPVEQGQLERIFVITMGYGKNLLCDDVIEERFGLKVILNTIKPSSLRRISKINIGGNQKLSYEQLPLKAEISEFGFDINRDIISNIAGESDDADYTTGILAGGDILTLSANVDITNIREFLIRTYQKYCLTTYRTNFGWIDQIQYIKDACLIDTLDAELLKLIHAKSPCIWMAVPEIINWEEIKGFNYTSSILHDDIQIDTVTGSLRKPLTSIEQLKSKRIYTIDAASEAIRHNWSAYRCLCGEIDYSGDTYCINCGKWYKINRDFVNQITQDYESAEVSAIDFDSCPVECRFEKDYSVYFQQHHSEDFIVMDQKIIVYGGGHSKIELCDLLSKDKTFIHIKPYTGSSTLSHLFNQATVSAELLLSDNRFLTLANQEIKEVTADDQFIITSSKDVKEIVFGIISKNQPNRPKIPFFSKVTFQYAKNRLQAYGLSVSIKTIPDLRP